jgi:hypothetical protein
MMNRNAPQPPERPLLDVLAERAYLDLHVREIAEEIDAEEAAKRNSSIAKQERMNYALCKMLGQMRDNRNGN